MRQDEIGILFEDGEIVIINKPAGISVTGDRSGTDDILDILGEAFGLTEGLRLVHRLDKFTSGAMILAKTRQAQSKYSTLFSERLIRKTYLALAAGAAKKASGTINSPLAQDPRDSRRMRVDAKRGKAAVTRYRTLADFGGIVLLAVYPETGRTHQIRVHLASIGLPLAVDPLYGSARPIMLSQIKPGYRPRKDKGESPLIERLTLHAYQLEIPWAESLTRTVVAPLERKFAAAVKMLTKHNPQGIEAFQDRSLPAALLDAQPIQ